MELKQEIINDLQINSNYIKVSENLSIKCLIHQKWLSQLLLDMKIPLNFSDYDSLSETECELLLNQSSSVEISSWLIFIINAIPKYDGKIQRLSRMQNQCQAQVDDLSYFQLMHYVSETNYRNLWKDAWKKYSLSEHNIKKRNKELQNYNEVIEEIINRLYQCPIIRISENSTSASSSSSGSRIDNLLQAVCAVEASNYYYLIQYHQDHTLHDCVTFSPAILESSTTRCLFLIYQLLHVLRSVHNKGLYLGVLTLYDIKINQKLWIKVIPKMWNDILHEAKIQNSFSNSKFSAQFENKANSKQYFEKECILLKEDKDKLHTLVNIWVKGQISNFDYIMELNKLAGREMNNPSYHPVLPWIMDFTVPEGGWRDLSKSKYRLNKGDRQLDLVYESATNGSNSSSTSGIFIPLDSAIQVPHHVSEILSDITYYVYKARRLPISVLCHHVRRKWVPAEYPASIQRLQEWTPDECIPEFYCDSSLFYSIHPDLPDLAVPWWCNGPEDFIRKHRMALESDYVSERLHHWIDLTFGYKLSGSAAIKSKNVCLPLVDQHTTLTNNGVVQLFTFPHPHKLSPSLYIGKNAPKIFKTINPKIHPLTTKKKIASDSHSQDSGINSELRDSGDEENSEGKTFKKKYFKYKTFIEPACPEFRPESQTIVLSKDYNPLATLNQLESLISFTAQTSCTVSSFEFQLKQDKNLNHTYHHFKSRDMMVFGCLIVEIALAPKLRIIPRNITFEERYNIIIKLLKSHFHEVPRCFQEALKLLLQIDFPKKQINEKTTVPFQYPPVTFKGLPPPSAHQLLQPLIRILPFPSYFSELYSFIHQMNHYSACLEDIKKNYTLENKQEKIYNLSMAKINLAMSILPSLLNKLNQEGLDLLTPYLQDLFECPDTALLAAWHLFNMVAQALGPQQTVRKFLVTIIHLFDPDIPSPKHLKLYHRSYLLQLMVRLGLLTFLAHFMTLIIEATGGFRDFSSNNNLSAIHTDATDSAIRKGSHLHSPELEQLVHNAETDDGIGLPETVSSPYDDDSSQTDLLSNRSGKNSGNGTDGEPEIFVLEAAGDDDDDTELMKNEENKERNKEESEQIDRSLSFLETSLDHEKWAEDSTEQQRAADEHFDEPELEIDLPDEPDEEQGIDIPGLNTSPTPLFSSSVPNLPSQMTQWSLSEIKKKTKLNPVEDVCGNITQKSFNSNKAKNKSECDINISDVAAESVIWLAHRLGPVLTAKYLTRNLLRMLSLCYNGNDHLSFVSQPPEGNSENIVSISQRWIVGDENASKVLESLSSIAALYGEQFILLQYLPHISELLSNCKRRINDSLEAGIVGGTALVKHIIPYLSDATLMDNLQDLLIKGILYPIIRLISSFRQTFPHGKHSRCVIAWKLIDTIYLIGLRIGFEMTRKHLSTLLQRFFSCFDKAYENHPFAGKKSTRFEGMDGAEGSGNPIREMALEEIKYVFTPELAYISYIHFCKLAGGIHMEQTLKNEELIRHLCAAHDSNLEIIFHPQKDIGLESSEVSMKSHQRIPSLGQDDTIVSGEFGKNVAVVGNRIDIHSCEDNQLSNVKGNSNPYQLDGSKLTDIPKYDIDLLRRRMDNTQRHLKGNWLLYWEHEIGRSDKDYHFNFKQIKLQSFIGHTGSVRTIHVLDNENSFLTGSKDKTVKLWSLRSCGNGSTQTSCQWTYTHHRKSVFAVAFLDSLRLVGSCDSTVHIWDPFVGSCIHQLDSSKGSIVTVLTAMPSPSSSFIAATTSSTVRFLDARTCRYMHEYKVSTGPAGLIRCVTISPNGYWLAVGHSSGIISVLDVRSGLLFETWMGHEGEILNLKAFNNNCFVSTSLDHSVSVWNAEEAKLKCYLRGPVEPVTCLSFHRGEVITGTTANKIGVHSSIENQYTFTSTRLRSDTFKGLLTSMALLPLNRLLLLGADNGGVSLLC